MLRATDPQLENLMYLRDVVIPQVLKMPIVDRGNDFDFKGDGLNLGNYATGNQCGTVGCLLGHYAMMRYGATNLKMFCGSVDRERLVVDDFGEDACGLGLFQGNRNGYKTPHDDIRERTKTLENIIAAKVMAL